MGFSAGIMLPLRSRIRNNHVPRHLVVDTLMEQYKYLKGKGGSTKPGPTIYYNWDPAGISTPPRSTPRPPSHPLGAVTGEEGNTFYLFFMCSGATRPEFFLSVNTMQSPVIVLGDNEQCWWYRP
jgi:hypothetical protein